MTDKEKILQVEAILDNMKCYYRDCKNFAYVGVKTGTRKYKLYIPLCITHAGLPVFGKRRKYSLDSLKKHKLF